MRHKSAVDIVTDVDLQSEREVCAHAAGRVSDATPSWAKKAAPRPASDPRYRWIVDPLDGTTNYAHGFPFFCVSIGLEVDGQLALGRGVCAQPGRAVRGRGRARRDASTVGRSASRRSTISAQALLATGFPYDRAEFPRALRSFEVVSLQSQAVRRAGSAVLDLCYVACGRLDGYWEHASSRGTWPPAR